MDTEVEPTTRSSHSLAVVIALWTAAALATTMALYALVQYAFMGPGDLWTLVLAHLSHVAVLTVAVYLVLVVVLGRLVVRPVRSLGSHLYRIGAGRVEPIALTTRVAEIEQLAAGVNRMVMRMELSGWRADGKSNSLFPYEEQVHDGDGAGGARVDAE